jgi:hypothetical protein
VDRLGRLEQAVTFLHPYQNDKPKYVQNKSKLVISDKETTQNV